MMRLILEADESIPTGSWIGFGEGLIVGPIARASIRRFDGCGTNLGVSGMDIPMTSVVYDGPWDAEAEPDLIRQIRFVLRLIPNAARFLAEPKAPESWRDRPPLL